MARKLVRVGDSHACGATDVSGSPNVFANGKPVHRCGDASSHGATQVECSSNVFANNKGIARIGDDHSGCPGLHPPNPEVTGSPDTYVN